MTTLTEKETIKNIIKDKDTTLFNVLEKYIDDKDTQIHQSRFVFDDKRFNKTYIKDNDTTVREISYDISDGDRDYDIKYENTYNIDINKWRFLGKLTFPQLIKMYGRLKKESIYRTDLLETFDWTLEYSAEYNDGDYAVEHKSTHRRNKFYMMDDNMYYVTEKGYDMYSEGELKETFKFEDTEEFEYQKFETNDSLTLRVIPLNFSGDIIEKFTREFDGEEYNYTLNKKYDSYEYPSVEIKVSKNKIEIFDYTFDYKYLLELGTLRDISPATMLECSIHANYMKEIIVE